jgi:hypothetical protein
MPANPDFFPDGEISGGFPAASIGKLLPSDPLRHEAKLEKIKKSP